MSQTELDPSHIMQVGMGFWPSKTVLSAVELELFTHLGAEAMTGEEIGERLGLHPRGDLRLPRHARRAAIPGARRRRERWPLSQHRRDRGVPGQAEPGLHRRNPGDVQRAAVSILGRPHRGAADRQAAERGQAHRQGDVRRALQRPGEARAVHECDEGRLARQLPGVGREVRLLQVQDGLRRRGRHRPALHDPRRAPPASSVHELRPPGRRADRREGHRRRRADRPRHRRLGRLLRGSSPRGGRHHDGPDPPRLEPRSEDAADPVGLRGPPRRGRVHRHREPHRRRSPRERVRADDVAQHADRVRRRLRLHRQRLRRLVPGGRLSRGRDPAAGRSRRAPASPTSSAPRNKLAETPTLFVCHGDDGGPRIHPCRCSMHAAPAPRASNTKGDRRATATDPVFCARARGRGYVRRLDDELPAGSWPTALVITHSRPILLLDRQARVIRRG